jgi:hypothetical protein
MSCKRLALNRRLCNVAQAFVGITKNTIKFVSDYNQ